MDTGEEYPMKGTASAKALRFESQCERGGDASREAMGADHVGSATGSTWLFLGEMEPQKALSRGDVT